MDERLLAFLGTLVEIRAELGETVYEAALDRARVALAHEVMVEAERRALSRKPDVARGRDGDCLVVRFPRRTADGIDGRP